MNITATINAIVSHIQEMQSLLDQVSNYSKEACSGEFNLLKTQFKLWLLLCLVETSGPLYHLPFNQLIPLLLSVVPLNVYTCPKRVFTLEELHLDYNGEKGTPYYLAIQQYIIDVSHSFNASSLSMSMPLSTLTLQDYLLEHSKKDFIEALTSAPILGKLIT